MLDNLDVPPQRGFDPLNEATLLVAAIGPDEFESRKAALQRSEQQSAAVVILDTGLMDEDLQDQAIRVDKQMTLTALDLFATIVTASPLFGWFSLTGCR